MHVYRVHKRVPSFVDIEPNSCVLRFGNLGISSPSCSSEFQSQLSQKRDYQVMTQTLSLSEVNEYRIIRYITTLDIQTYTQILGFEPWVFTLCI